MSYMDIIKFNEASQKPHVWEIAEFNKKVVCCYCGSPITKKSKKYVGFKCHDCRAIAHKKCKIYVDKQCPLPEIFGSGSHSTKNSTQQQNQATLDKTIRSKRDAKSTLTIASLTASNESNAPVFMPVAGSGDLRSTPALNPAFGTAQGSDDAASQSSSSSSSNRPAKTPLRSNVAMPTKSEPPVVIPTKKPSKHHKQVDKQQPQQIHKQQSQLKSQQQQSQPQQQQGQQQPSSSSSSSSSPKRFDIIPKTNVMTGLPDNWSMRLDPQSGRYYYSDKKAKRTVWVPPPEVLDAVKLPPKWAVEVENGTNRLVYVDTVTRVRQYTYPDMSSIKVQELPQFVLKKPSLTFNPVKSQRFYVPPQQPPVQPGAWANQSSVRPLQGPSFVVRTNVQNYVTTPLGSSCPQFNNNNNNGGGGVGTPNNNRYRGGERPMSMPYPDAYGMKNSTFVPPPPPPEFMNGSGNASSPASRNSSSLSPVPPSGPTSFSASATPFRVLVSGSSSPPSPKVQLNTANNNNNGSNSSNEGSKPINVQQDSHPPPQSFSPGKAMNDERKTLLIATVVKESVYNDNNNNNNNNDSDSVSWSESESGSVGGDSVGSGSDSVGSNDDCNINDVVNEMAVRGDGNHSPRPIATTSSSCTVDASMSKSGSQSPHTPQLLHNTSSALSKSSSPSPNGSLPQNSNNKKDSNNKTQLKLDLDNMTHSSSSSSSSPIFSNGSTYSSSDEDEDEKDEKDEKDVKDVKRKIAYNDEVTADDIFDKSDDDGVDDIY